MNILLDTNVISEIRRPRPDPNVMAWLENLDEDRAFLSVITLAEIQRGAALLPEGARRHSLFDWLAIDLPARFDNRILPVTAAIALAWGDLSARAQQAGKSDHAMDGLIAATAHVHDMALATRNVRHFEHLLVTLINPWQAG